jgi:hypothetical protein
VTANPVPMIANGPDKIGVLLERAGAALESAAKELDACAGVDARVVQLRPVGADAAATADHPLSGALAALRAAQTKPAG